MKDVFDAYKQQKTKKNIAIISFALIFGIGINALISTAPVKQFTASVGNFSDNGKVAVTKDIHLVADKAVEVSTGDKKEVKNPTILSLINTTGLSHVKEIRASLLFDPNTLQLTDFFSENKEVEIIKITNEPGIVTLNIRYKTLSDISADTKIVRISYEKKNTEKTVINLAETTFVTDNGNYSLSNEPVEF